MVYIACFTELILQMSDEFVAKIVNTRLTKIFMAIFASDERLPSSATLTETKIWTKKISTGFSGDQMIMQTSSAHVCSMQVWLHTRL